MKQVILPKKQHIEKKNGFDVHVSDHWDSKGLVWIDFLYCANCFCNILILSPANEGKPLEEQSYHCALCSNFDSMKYALKELPSDAEMKQQKALKIKQLEDEQDDLEDEIDDLERQKENFK